MLAIVGAWFANVGCEDWQGFWLFVGYVGYLIYPILRTLFLISIWQQYHAMACAYLRALRLFFHDNIAYIAYIAF